MALVTIENTQIHICANFVPLNIFNPTVTKFHKLKHFFWNANDDKINITDGLHNYADTLQLIFAFVLHSK